MNKNGYHNKTFFEELLCRFPNNIHYRAIDQLVAESVCVATLFGNEYANSSCPPRASSSRDEQEAWNRCVECWRREIEDKDV